MQQSRRLKKTRQSLELIVKRSGKNPYLEISTCYMFGNLLKELAENKANIVPSCFCERFNSALHDLLDLLGHFFQAVRFLDKAVGAPGKYLLNRAVQG